MFYLVTIGGCILSILGGSSARSYTIGNGKTQDYSGTYSAGGFIGLKDADHRYGSSLSSSSSGHSAYNDGQGSAYLGSSSSSSNAGSSGTSTSGTSTSTTSINNSTPDILNSISSDAVSDMSTGYTPGASSLEYNSPSSHGSVNFAGYAGSQQSSSDHSSFDYPQSSSSSSSSTSSSSSSSSPSSSPYSSPYSSSSSHQNSYSGGKISPYTSSNSHAASPYSNYHGHSNSYPSSSLSSSYSGLSHSGSFPSSRYTSSSFPASHSAANNHPESLRFTSTAALNNYLSTLHGNVPSYSHNSIANHHGPNYIHAASSNVVPSYSKSSSGYFQGGAFPKGGSKIIIIKDGHGNTGGMMHSEHPGFSTNIYGSGSNYKVRSAGPFSSGYANGYGPSSGYSGGHYSAPSTLGSLFGF